MDIKAKILVIEDQYSFLLRASLERLNGFEFVTVERGHEALKLLKEQRFDIILTDLRLPDISGIDLIRQMRSLTAAPIIALTAYDIGSKRVEALEAGADAFFGKPPNYERLHNKIVELYQVQPDRNERQERVTKMRRLQKLKEQRAAKGPDTPAHILIEIEDLEYELNAKPSNET